MTYLGKIWKWTESEKVSIYFKKGAHQNNQLTILSEIEAWSKSGLNFWPKDLTLDSLYKTVIGLCQNFITKLEIRLLYIICSRHDFKVNCLEKSTIQHPNLW